MKITINGTLYEEANAKISVLDHGLLLGDGVFETLRTLGGRLMHYEKHHRRLVSSAKKIGLQVPAAKEALRKQILENISANNLSEARVRVTLTRGVGPLGLTTKCENPSLIIISNQLTEKDYSQGVKVITCEMQRLMPRVKSLSYLPSVMAKKMAEDAHAFEAIFVDEDGIVCEGSFSNVFIVKGNKITTPSENILPGITRGIVIELAKKDGINVSEEEVSLDELIEADEVFLTFSTAGVVAVSKINDTDKKVGEITLRIMRLYTGACANE